MAMFVARVAEHAKSSKKETKAVLEAMKTVLQEHLETQPGKKIRVPGLFTAVALRRPGKEARTKKVFGKVVEIPFKAPHTIVRLLPNSKLCVKRVDNA